MESVHAVSLVLPANVDIVTQRVLFVDHLFVFNRAAQMLTCWWKAQEGMQEPYIVAIETDEIVQCHIYVEFDCLLSAL